jgi:hypothetical protein
LWGEVELPLDPNEAMAMKKRGVVLILAIVLATLGLYSWASGLAPPRILWIIGFGVILAGIYVVRGSLPEFIHRFADINRDDDPTNLLPRVYLPIVIAALLVAAALLAWTCLR